MSAPVVHVLFSLLIANHCSLACPQWMTSAHPTPMSLKCVGLIMRFHGMGSCSVLSYLADPRTSISIALISICTCASFDFTEPKGAYGLCSLLLLAPH